MPEILQDKTLQWFRVKRNAINTWDDFRYEAERFFLPKRHLAHLEETIHQRKQFPREKAKDYVLAIQTLIRQHPKLRDEDHTERIYDGLRVEYRLYVRRSDFSSVDELLELTEDYELLRSEEARQARNTNHCLTAINEMKHVVSGMPHASGRHTKRQPQPPDEPQKPQPFRPPPEARPRVHPNTTGAHQLHAISTDDTGSAARTRPRVPRQPLERSVIKASTRSRPATEPAVVEVLPRQTPLSTNARKLPTTRRAPTPREADHEAGAATEPRAAQTSTHPAVQAKAQVTLSAKQSDLTTAASLQLVQRGTATSTVRAEASTAKPLAEKAQKAPATTTPACSNDDGASAPATATTSVETTPPHPKATPTPTTTRPPIAEIIHLYE
ncbi:proteoglycan 4-like [Bactrocera neohumeralis]|uniref:proteoglycan 4-like n=1 Tax=Bactrocera neohumeralis TaxID=98809 RepID=UPI0021657918|nr:proteoglycan 4-like [Bactrocera neohumeralis]